MQAILQNKLPEVIALLRKNKVVRAFAFGSVVSDKFTDKSDIDFLIAFDDKLHPFEYADNYWELTTQLQEMFNRNIDLVTEKTLKNPYLIKSINASKVSLL